MIDCTKIPFKDKGCHFLAGLGIALVGGLLSSSYIFAIVLGSLAGVAKEVYDYKDYGVFDKDDLIVTMIGAAVGGVIIQQSELFLF